MGEARLKRRGKRNLKTGRKEKNLRRDGRQASSGDTEGSPKEREESRRQKVKEAGDKDATIICQWTRHKAGRRKSARWTSSRTAAQRGTRKKGKGTRQIQKAGRATKKESKLSTQRVKIGWKKCNRGKKNKQKATQHSRSLAQDVRSSRVEPEVTRRHGNDGKDSGGKKREGGQHNARRFRESEKKKGDPDAKNRDFHGAHVDTVRKRRKRSNAQESRKEI